MSIVRHGLLGLIGLALGCIWLASAAGNFAHGVQLSGTSPYWWVYGLASASADVLKATALLGLTPAWRAHWGVFTKTWAILGLLVIFTLTLGWGVRSCAGFISTTLSDTTSTRDMHGVADKSLRKQIDDQVQQITKLQDLKMRSSSRDWEKIEAEIGRVEERLDRLRGKARTENSAGAADPVGELLQRWISPETTRFGTVILFLLMLEAVASLGLMAFAPLLGIDYNRIAEMLASPANGTNSPDLSQNGNAPPPAEKKPMLATKKRRVRSSPPSGMRIQALTLLATLEEKYGVGSGVLKSEVFRVYLALADRHGWERLDNIKLGKQMSHIGVLREEPDAQGRIYYQLPTAAEKAALRSKGVNGKGEDGLPLA